MPGIEKSRSETNPWVVLLEDTRRALSLLRTEDLEDLAARAQCMLNATIAEELILQRMSLPDQSELSGLGRQQHLLGSLLKSTGNNMKILEHADGDAKLPWVL